MKIKSLKAIEILDSRGNPTLRTFLTLDDGSVHSASVPSGSSTGTHEAVELRDQDKTRYFGKGMMKAARNLNSVINNALKGMSVSQPKALDRKMLELDGTENKAKLGANAILSVSLAAVRAASYANRLPLWKFINRHYFPETAPSFPRLMVNIVNGGKHAAWNFDIQECMVVPKNTVPSKAVQTAAEIFQSLGQNLKKQNLSALLGDEGGYSPALSTNEEALEAIRAAAEDAGHPADFDFALDCAANEWLKDGKYISHKTGGKRSVQTLIKYYVSLEKQFHIASFEDPFGEDEWNGFEEFTKLANDIMVVGDDLYATNPERIKKGIKLNATNAIVIKLNQIGTVSETVEAIKLAKSAHWKTIISHRSGETEDPFIADLAYGSGTDFIKAGSMARSERLAKYNRLIEIENGL